MLTIKFLLSYLRAVQGRKAERQTQTDKQTDRHPDY